MKIIAALLIGMVTSVILLLVKTTTRWKPWLAFYFLWMIIPASFYFINDYISFYRTIGGKILFLITLIIIMVLWFINKKKPSKLLTVIQQLVTGINFPMLMIDCWITTFKMIGRVVRFIFSK